MIKLIGAELSFGSRSILDHTDWMLGDCDRVGLVGENGSGKTTVLKVMAGLLELEQGAVEVTRGLTIGYLPQSGVTHHGRSLEDEVREAVRPVLALEDERRSIQAMMEEAPPEKQEALAGRLAEVMDRFRLRGGFELEARIGKVLKGLGFTEEDRKRPVEHFSGGWQMRIALAKLLLKSPDVLLLDEPTNHLDLDARNWLEEFLADFPNSFIVVSHDRYFMDVSVKRIAEIEDGRINDYRGNYSYYRKEKERRIEAAFAAYEKQADEIQRLKAFINKYKADKKRAGQVGSRAKMLEKIKPLEEPRAPRRARISFPSAPPSPQLMLRLDHVSKRYDSRTVFENVNLSFFRGSKVAVVGPNGSGKSTLLKVMSGKLRPDGGERDLAERVDVAYFDQGAGDELDPELSVLDTISKGAPLDIYPALRNILGAFLFRGNDVEKKVGDLSGGEKSRLALARLLLRPANLLMLDEPTNHLDLAAKELLMDAMKSYAGALVYVAHDRWFLEELPDTIVEVKDGKVRDFPGDYSDYLRALARIARPETKPAPEKKDAPLNKAERVRLREHKKEQDRKRQKVERGLAELEDTIHSLEKRIESLDAEMADPLAASNYQRLMDLDSQRKKAARKLESSLGEWERLGQVLSSLQPAREED